MSTAKKWDHREFRRFVEAAMAQRGISKPAELARLMGVTDANLSKWMNGRSQPSRPSLRKMSEALDVALPILELNAGLIEADELEIQPRPILPLAFERALDAYNKATLDHPDLVAGLLERVDYATQWFDVQVALKRPQRRK